jgi:sugar O-acyltransferase (sialic acid O-acetyltransferase NeuD family)
MTVDVGDPIVVLGAGGHGKVVADILLAANERVIGFLDANKPAGVLVLGLPVLGPTTWLATNRARVALGVGDNAARARAADEAVSLGAVLVTAVHPRAVVSPSSRIDEGAVVAALAVVNPEAHVGRGAIVNTGAVIEHDCIVGAFAHVSPNASMAGGCRLGALAHLGIGASMLPGTSVGEATIVGGNALVARDLPSGVIAFGVPARVHRSR